MTRSRVVLPAPFGPIRPVNWPGATENETPLRIWRPPSRDAYVLQAQQVVVCHRCSVETLAVTALSRALTSAVIQVW